MTIKKGNHRPFLPTLGLYIDKVSITRRVTFNTNCRYTLPDGDQEDINKLFGIGYFWSHHTDSARFGWRYNPSLDKIEIWAYCYLNGARYMSPIDTVEFDKEYKFTLEIDNNYTFTIVSKADPVIIPKTHDKEFAYPLGLYFGGNQVAPHDMTIKINK